MAKAPFSGSIEFKLTIRAFDEQVIRKARHLHLYADLVVLRCAVSQGATRFMVGRRSWEQERHTQGLDRGRLIASSAWS